MVAVVLQGITYREDKIWSFSEGSCSRQGVSNTGDSGKGATYSF